MEVGDQRHAPAALPRERDPVPAVQEAGWAPGPAWKGAENLPPPQRDSIPRPSSPSLYRPTRVKLKRRKLLWRYS